MLYKYQYIDHFVLDWGISIAPTMEIAQSSTKPSIYILVVLAYFIYQQLNELMDTCKI